MRTSRRLRALGALAVLVGVTALPSVTAAAPQAQSNLLTNPGFEGGWYHWNNVPEISVPNGWDFWYALEGTPLLEPQDSPWGRPEVVTWFYPAGFAETWFWRDGEHTLKVFGAWHPIWFRISQTVSGLTPGAEYKFVAPVFPETVAEYVEGGTRGRKFSDDPLAGEFLLRARTGDQVYSSGWVNEHVVPAWQWTLLSLTFVAQSDTATVEAEVRGRWGLVNNAFFIDDLSLTPTGASEAVPTATTASGEAAPAPTAGGQAPAEQPAPSAEFPPINTPLANGEVWYEVRGGDTLFVVAYYHGTTPDAIKELNGLTDNFIYPGQKLLIQVVDPPATATSEAEPSETSVPSETPVEVAAAPAAAGAAPEEPEAAPKNLPEYGEVCVLAYDDANLNAENDGEEIVSGAHVILVNESGPMDSRMSGRSGETECFQRLAPGAYRVTVLPPNGFRLTTADVADVTLQQGSIVTLAFGFGPSEPINAQQSSGRTTSLYALGAGVLLLIVAGFVGLRLAASRRR